MNFRYFNHKSGHVACTECKEDYETNPRDWEMVEEEQDVEISCKYCNNEIEGSKDD